MILDIFFSLLNFGIFVGVVSLLFFRYIAPVVAATIRQEAEEKNARAEKLHELSSAHQATLAQRNTHLAAFAELEKKVTLWKHNSDAQQTAAEQERRLCENRLHERIVFRARACAVNRLEHAILLPALAQARAQLREKYSSPEAQAQMLENSIKKIKQV